MKKTSEEVQKFGLSIQPTRTKDLGEGQVEVTISTESKDRHGEKIKLDGISTKHYNGTVLYGHDYQGLPIGKSIKIWKDKNTHELKSILQFAIKEYEFARTVYDLVKGGYLTDVSIGGLVEKWNDDYTVIENLEMVEYSVVPVGANRDAKITAKALGKTVEDIQKEYEDALRKHLAEKLESVPKDDIAAAVKSMKVILAALEGEVDSPSDADNKTAGRKKMILMRSQAKALAEKSEHLNRVIKFKLKGE